MEDGSSRNDIPKPVSARYQILHNQIFLIILNHLIYILGTGKRILLIWILSISRFQPLHLNPCANVVNAAEIIDLDDAQQGRRGSFGGNVSDDNNSSNNKGLTRRERYALHK